MNFTALDDLEAYFKTEMDKEKKESALRLDNLRKQLMVVTRARGQAVLANNDSADEVMQ